MADDFLLAAITGALEGFGSAYVPYKKAQYEDFFSRRRLQEQSAYDLAHKRTLMGEEDKLARAREEAKFQREEFATTEELAPEAATTLGAKAGQRFRIKTLPSTLSYLGRKESSQAKRNLMERMTTANLKDLKGQLLKLSEDATITDEDESMLGMINEELNKRLRGLSGKTGFKPPPASGNNGKGKKELDDLFQGLE